MQLWTVERELTACCEAVEEQQLVEVEEPALTAREPRSPDTAARNCYVRAPIVGHKYMLKVLKQRNGVHKPVEMKGDIGSELTDLRVGRD